MGDLHSHRESVAEKSRKRTSSRKRASGKARTIMYKTALDRGERGMPDRKTRRNERRVNRGGNRKQERGKGPNKKKRTLATAEADRARDSNPSKKNSKGGLEKKRERM